jgi:hypothetical protein
MTDGEFRTSTDARNVADTVTQAIAIAVGIAPIVGYLNGWVGFETAALWYLAAITLIVNEIHGKVTSMP